MASVKKGWRRIFGLLLILGAAAASLPAAEDDVLFEDDLLDDSSMVIADPADPAEADLAAAAQEETTDPQMAQPDPGTDIDLEPREVPETMPLQTGTVPDAPPPQGTGQTAPDGRAPLQTILPPQNNLQPDTAGAGQTPEDGTAELPPQESAPDGMMGEENPPEEVTAEEEGSAAEGEEIELVKELCLPPDSVLEQLRGKPVSLSDALNGVTQPDRRREVTEAYWDLAETLALYHLSLIYGNDVEDCISRFTKEGSPSPGVTAALISARRLAAQRAAEARVTFGEAQCRFAELARRTAEPGHETVSLAIPADAPNTLPYRTRFERISREKRLAPQAAYLAEAIPARYEMTLLYNKAAADALEAYRTLYFAGGTSAEILLSAADKLCDAKERLVRAVGEYNKLIAAYVAETVSSDVRGDRLISTMIPVPDRTGLPKWNDPEPVRTAAVPIPTLYSPRQPRPVSAEIPHFDATAPPNDVKLYRPGLNAEMLR